MKTGHNQSEIAEEIGVHKSTVSRELRRNKDLRGYRHKQAHDLVIVRRGEKVRRRIDAGTWEQGLNENTNGLIRQYFPKGRDFATITDSEIQTVMDKLNNRPRKCLGFKTPNEVFFGIKSDVALSS